MHPILQRVFKVRNIDLHRWGKFNSRFMIIFACLLLIGSVYSYYFISNNITPTIDSIHKTEEDLIKEVVDKDRKHALQNMLELRKAGGQDILEGIKYLLLGGGIGFSIIAFQCGILLLRAHELSKVSLPSEDSQ